MLPQPLFKHTHTHFVTQAHMYCTILTSEALVMHQTLPRARSEKTSSVIHSSWPSSHSLTHSSSKLNNTTLTKCTWGTCMNICVYPPLKEPEWRRMANENRLCTRRICPLRTVTIMTEEISQRGGLNVHGTIYFLPSVYRCLSWHFSIKRIRLSGAQKQCLANYEGDPTNGWALIN